MAGRRKKAALPGCDCIAKDGLDALEKSHRNLLSLGELVVEESVDIDSCFKTAEPNACRWDYYVGIRRHGEFYMEVHEVSEDELQALNKKAEWLRGKRDALSWPATAGRPFFVAPTKVSPGSAFGDLSRRLAKEKIVVFRKGDSIKDLLD